MSKIKNYYHDEIVNNSKNLEIAPILITRIACLQCHYETLTSTDYSTLTCSLCNASFTLIQNPKKYVP